MHVDHVGWPAVGASDISLLSVDGGNPIDGLDLERVALYAPTEGTDDGRRARLTVVTRGAAGCTTLADAETIDVPAHPVDVVSTLGGGDVFRGSLLACLVRGVELRDALVRANACAALSCRALDGRSAIPIWAELERSIGG